MGQGEDPRLIMHRLAARCLLLPARCYCCLAHCLPPVLRACLTVVFFSYLPFILSTLLSLCSPINTSTYFPSCLPAYLIACLLTSLP